MFRASLPAPESHPSDTITIDYIVMRKQVMRSLGSVVTR